METQPLASLEKINMQKYKNILALDSSNAGHLVLRIITPDNYYDTVQNVRLESELISCIDDLLKKASLTIQDIDAFILGQGPGSFMGLRLGFTVIRTWAWLYKKPIAMVSSLDLLARSFALENDSYDVYVPCIDAKMKKVFANIQQIGLGDCDITPQELANLLPKNQKIAIIGSDILKEFIDENLVDFYPEFKITAECFDRENSYCFEYNIQNIVPNYLRLSAAEISLEEKNK